MEPTGEKKSRVGKVFSINYSKVKGVSKTPIGTGKLIEDFGLEDDSHSGPGIRQVSLLSIESIKKQEMTFKEQVKTFPHKVCDKVRSQNAEINPGDFAENITTENIDLSSLKIGDRLKIGDEIIIEISKIGKECHNYCEIYKKIGNCIMPKEGIFAKIIKGGTIKKGDMIKHD